MFHSIGAGLEEIYSRYATVAEANEIGMPRADMQMGKKKMATELRKIAAEGICDREPEDFLNMLLQCVQQKQANMWDEGWNPIKLLKDNNFGCLVNKNSVEAVSAATQECDDAIVIWTKMPSNASERCIVAHGSMWLNKLKGDFKDIVTRMGNTHWGNVADVCEISKKLNVGCVVFGNKPQQAGIENQQWMYSVAQQRADYYFWICLYCVNNRHFQLLQLAPVIGATHWQSAFRRTRMPTPLLEHFNACNASCLFGTRRTDDAIV